MSESDLKLNPEAPSRDEGSIPIAPCPRSGLEALFYLLSGIELGPRLPRAIPRAIPMTVSADTIRLLVGLRFETAAEAQDFANGLADFVDRDGERVLLKKAAVINRDPVGNCSGFN